MESEHLVLRAICLKLPLVTKLMGINFYSSLQKRPAAVDLGQNRHQ